MNNCRNSTSCDEEINSKVNNKYSSSAYLLVKKQNQSETFKTLNF